MYTDKNDEIFLLEICTKLDSKNVIKIKCAKYSFWKITPSIRVAKGLFQALSHFFFIQTLQKYLFREIGS